MRYLTVGRPESHRRDLVLALGLTLGALFIAGMSLEARIRITEGVRSTVLAPFLAAHRLFAHSADLSARVAELTQERERLAAQLLEAADLELENRQLRIIAGLPERRRNGFAVGDLTSGAPETGVSHTFLFRSRSGVIPVTPAGVSSPYGLVGVLRTFVGGSGAGEFWTHPDFRVSVRTPNGAATGIIRAFAESGGDTMMLLEGIPFQTNIPAGTLLVTSGIGGVHPGGIPVGRVMREADARSGWSHSYLVEPVVRPAQVSVGLVWLAGGARPAVRAPND